MKIFKVSLILALICVVVSSSALRSGDNDIGASRDSMKVETLSLRERLFLLLASKLHPRSSEKMSQQLSSELLSYSFLAYIDNFFVDARQLFIQAKKLDENAYLPEFNWGYDYNFCLLWCFDLRVEFSTKDTTFVGSDTISSSTEVTPTSIHNTFKVGAFNWTSPGFLLNITDYDYEEIYFYRDTYYSFENLTIGIDSDYHFVPDIGVQMDNLTIHFYAGRIRGGISDYSLWDFNGNLLESQYLDPQQNEISESMMTDWNYYKREYSSNIQFGLNCILSNGRSSYECNNHDATVAGDYYSLLTLQLIQTIGLGSLLN